MASHGLLASAMPILSAAGGLSGIAAVVTLVYKRREQKQADRAAASAEQYREFEAARELTTTALSLLDPVKRALGEAEERIKALQRQVVDLETAAATLTTAMEALAAASQAERAELETRLAEVTAERDAATTKLGAVTQERDELLVRLAAQDAELEALRRQTHGSAA